MVRPMTAETQESDAEDPVRRLCTGAERRREQTQNQAADDFDDSDLTAFV